ncbi:hypothetical protein [uncultured Croceitalea sp.]|uniref:hypothetical protein n=1 Tax=uncultured Croceitalea sp. TaxID=1798908 RepID=UPI0033067AC9
MELIINVFLIVLGLYFGLGLIFGLYFVFIGGTKLDSFLKDSKKIVRLLLFPGVIATWPFLLRKLLNTEQDDS